MSSGCTRWWADEIFTDACGGDEGIAMMAGPGIEARRHVDQGLREPQTVLDSIRISVEP